MNNTEALLSLMDEQEMSQEEIIQIPLDYDAVKKIANILSQTSLQTGKVEEDRVSESLAAYALIENSNHLTFFKVKGSNLEQLQSLILSEIRDEILGDHQDPFESLEEMAFEISNEIYSDFFSRFRGDYLKNKSVKVKKLSTTKINSQEGIELFIPVNFEYIVAAKTIFPLLEGVEGRLPYVEDKSEIKDLIGIKIFKDLIRNEDYVSSIDDKLVNYSTRDVFVYSVLKLHQDFFNYLEGQNEGI